jgi:predicted metal-binding protein
MFKQIIVSNWIRMKCRFDCKEFGYPACPLNVPSVGECKSFFNEYTSAVIFHFEKILDDPSDHPTLSIPP